MTDANPSPAAGPTGPETPPPKIPKKGGVPKGAAVVKKAPPVPVAKLKDPPPPPAAPAKKAENPLATPAPAKGNVLEESIDSTMRLFGWKV